MRRRPPPRSKRRWSNSSNRKRNDADARGRNDGAVWRAAGRPGVCRGGGNQMPRDALPEVLRRTFISPLVMAGVDLRTVQELAGHREIKMTLRYAHLAPESKRRAMGLLERQVPRRFPHSGAGRLRKRLGGP
ncbi:MAG: tyrosine-type recombinase/integrase [Verrucomicrobia bacterium]|nr:tyrosine-type recombinase/integrase [Verrucomicrobiota bacterium]